ncbi:MAG: hypothetical protein RLZZ609_37 [Cyanobacteriota bacterium]
MGQLPPHPGQIDRQRRQSRRQAGEKKHVAEADRVFLHAVTGNRGFPPLLQPLEEGRVASLDEHIGQQGQPCPHANTASNRIEMSSQLLRVIGALVEIRSTPLAA